MNSRPIAIDLFAGAGGLSLGLEQAGFKLGAAVEIDPIHAAVHHYNFPNCPVIPRSIVEVTGDNIRAAAGMTPGESPHLVAGGPPCQGFSIIGQQAANDPRNSLVDHYLRIVEELRPTYFLFENVKGLTTKRNQPAIARILLRLKELGYTVTRPYRVLDAQHYGVPQARERLFLMGALEGHPTPRYPAPQKGMVSCAEALCDLPAVECYPELWDGDTVPLTYPAPVNENMWLVPYIQEMRCLEPGHWHYGHQRSHPPYLLTNSQRTKHSAKSIARFKETEPGEVVPVARFRKLSAYGVSSTLRAGTDSKRGSFTSPRPVHYDYPRCITVREMARLHSFPDWFRLHTAISHGARQIGNSVPPALARALGLEILRALAHTPTRPAGLLPVGDEALLSMPIQAAADYWGVPRSIPTRDREYSKRVRVSKGDK